MQGLMAGWEEDQTTCLTLQANALEIGLYSIVKAMQKTEELLGGVDVFVELSVRYTEEI